MSVVEQEPFVLDADADEDVALHLCYEDGSVACGAPPSDHSYCSWTGEEWHGEAFCAGCGRPVCVYCRLHSEGDEE